MEFLVCVRHAPDIFICTERTINTLEDLKKLCDEHPYNSAKLEMGREACEEWGAPVITFNLTQEE